MLWLSAAVLNSHGQVPWNSYSLGQGDQTGKLTRVVSPVLSFQLLQCNRVTRLSRWFTYSKLADVHLRACAQTRLCVCANGGGVCDELCTRGRPRRVSV